MSLGDKLINLRKEKQLSQEEMAEKLGVTRQTISKWETNQSTPGFDNIIPLCELFEISTDELLNSEKIKSDSKSVEKSRVFEDTLENKKKRTIGLVTSILLYFISVIWLMVTIPVFRLDPIIATAVFLFICAIATCIIIYTSIMYKKEKTKKDEEDDKVFKQIEGVVSIIVVIIYLAISFVTMAWHITWIIWLIYALVMRIIKLFITLKDDKDEQ